MSVGPILMMLTSLAFLHFYPITEARRKKTKLDLENMLVFILYVCVYALVCLFVCTHTHTHTQTHAHNTHTRAHTNTRTNTHTSMIILQ